MSSAAAAAEAQSADASTPTAAPARREGRLAINRTWVRNVAAAACVVIAFSFVGWQVRQEFFPPSPYRGGGGMGQPAASIPAETVLNVLRTHDNCAKLSDHHLIPGDTPEAVRQTLTQQAGVIASATSLDAAWQFKGAGLCQVGSQRAAHMLFVRREEYVSVFSLPAPDDCGYGGGCYRDTVEKHPVAGFRRDNALYCVVGSGPNGNFTMSELEPILRKVQESVAAGRLSNDKMVAVALQFGHRD